MEALEPAAPRSPRSPRTAARRRHPRTDACAPLRARLLLPALALGLTLVASLAAGSLPLAPVAPGRDGSDGLADARSAPGAPSTATATPEPPSRPMARILIDTREAPDPWSPRIRIAFDRPMDRASVAGAIRVSPTFAYRLVWGRRTLRLLPLGRLRPGQRYSIELGAQARDLSGRAIQRGRTTGFTLPRLVRILERPRPAFDGEPLVLGFTTPMDRESVARSLAIDFPAELRWREPGTELELWPAEPLAERSAYRIRFGRPVTDAEGRSLPAPRELRLHTASALLGSEPQGSSISVDAAFELRFDRALDLASARAAFSISPTVEGALTLPEPERLRFTPAGQLEPHTRYTLHLGTDLVAAGGQPFLSQAIVLERRTGAYQPALSFGLGAPIQVLPAEGSRRIDFARLDPDAETLRFSLHPLSQEALLARLRERQMVWGDWDAPPEPMEPARPAIWSTRLELGPVEASERLHGWAGTGDARGRGQLTLPPEIPAGLYLLDAHSARRDAQLLLALTDLLPSLRQAPGQVELWVVNAARRPQSGVDLHLLDAAGSPLAAGRTDAEGRWRIDLPPDAAPALALLRRGADVSLVGLDSAWSSLVTAEDSSRTLVEAVPDGPRVHLYTDRPVYRPGQTVRVKAIVRLDAQGWPALPPAGSPVTLRARDARGNLLETFDLETSAFGTVHAELTLAEGVALGQHRFELALPQHPKAFGIDYQVEDYRKPDLALELDEALLPPGLLGEGDGAGGAAQAEADAEIRLAGRARYHFGAAAAEVELRARVFRLHRRPADSDSGELGEDRWRWVELDGGSLGPTRADAEGRFTLGLPVERLLDWSREGELPPDVERLAIEVEASDGSGQQITSARILPPGAWLSALVGQGWTPPRASAEPPELRIEAERQRYAPGETARVSIHSRLPGTALLGVERGRILRSRLIELTPPETLVELPIERGDVPNVYLNVRSWLEEGGGTREDRWWGAGLASSDRVLRSATLALEILPEDRRLQVELEPDLDRYAPGDRARLRLRVRDGAGRPVEAELSLALVDEAVLALAPEAGAPLFESFYRPRRHGVEGFDGLAPWRGLSCECGGGGGGGGDFDAANPRGSFADTAFWLPALRTDAEGRAELEIPLTDDVTRWRLQAKAVAGAEAFGEAMIALETRQEIVVTPLLPRAATQGDRLLASVLVQNTGTEARDLLLRLLVEPVAASAGRPATELESSRGDVEGAPLPDRPEQRVRLAPGERRIVGWPLRVDTIGALDLVFAASRADGEAGGGDARRARLEVAPLARPELQSWSGTATKPLRMSLELPEDLLPGSQLRVTLGHSIAGSLLDGAEHLVGYPYGCVEQTMSRALPNAVVGRALRELGSLDPELARVLDDAIAASLQRLYGFQHEDGGWGWWEDDPTDDYQTAWVVFGLAVTAEAGHAGDPGVLDRGARRLEGRLGAMDPRTRALALYALARAGRPLAEPALALAEAADGLDAFASAALVLALADAGESLREGAADGGDGVAELGADRHELLGRLELQRASLLAGLVERAEREAGKAHWPGESSDGVYDRKTMASTLRASALVLSALVRLDPHSPLEDELVRWLMDRRQADGGWGTTNETSFAMLGLTDHLRAAGEGEAAPSYRLLLDGEPVADGRLDRQAPRAELDLPLEALTPGRHDLRLLRGGDGPLYYTVAARLLRPARAIEAAGPIGITRRYGRPGGEGEPGRFAQGDLVEVRLDLDLPGATSYVIIEDRLPAGLEALNTALATTGHAASAIDRADDDPAARGYDHKEVRGDRVSFFVTELPAGRRSLRYLARATRPGRFTSLPAEAYAMYDPAVWGRSRSQPFAVTEGAVRSLAGPGIARDTDRPQGGGPWGALGD